MGGMRDLNQYLKQRGNRWYYQRRVAPRPCRFRQPGAHLHSSEDGITGGRAGVPRFACTGRRTVLVHRRHERMRPVPHATIQRDAAGKARLSGSPAAGDGKGGFSIRRSMKTLPTYWTG